MRSELRSKRQRADWPVLARLLSPRGRVAAVAVPALLILNLTALVAPGATPRPALREIELLARDMTFYLAGDTQAGPNPTLWLEAGEEVRIVLRNQDPGITHNFAVTAWNVSMKAFQGEGAPRSVLVRAPQRPGRFEYVCTPHSAMMAGVIEVVASVASNEVKSAAALPISNLPW